MASRATAAEPINNQFSAASTETLRPEMRREILGIFLALGGLFVALSLATPMENYSFMGPAGASVREGVRFVLGMWVGWTLPLLLIAASVMAFLGRPIARLPIRIIGFLGVIISSCALLALSGADVPELKTQSFHQAGALGVFLMNADGLGLSWQLGSAGAIITFGGTLLISMLLLTDMLLATLFLHCRGLWMAWLSRRRAAQQAKLAEVQSPLWRSRLLTTLPDVDVEPIGGAFAFDDSGIPPSPPSPPSPHSLPSHSLPSASLSSFSSPSSYSDAPPTRRRRWSLFGDEKDSDLVTAFNREPVSFDDKNLATSQAVAGSELTATASSVPPTIIDGFSPLPVANSKDGASLWSLDDEAPPSRSTPAAAGSTAFSNNAALESSATGKKIGLTGFGGSLTRTPLVEDQKKNDADPSSSSDIDEDLDSDLNVETSETTDSDDEALDILSAAESRMLRRTADQIEPANDDPLFETADVAKRLGIAAATGAANTAEGKAAQDRTLNACDPAGVFTEDSNPDYVLPPVEVLDDPPKVDSRMPREELLEISQILEKTLSDFGIQAKVIQVTQGPVVTRFELKPAPGVKVSKITSLEQDISMALKATNPVRIIAPIPGKAAVGIEVPNRCRAGVYLKELISCDSFWSHSSALAFGLGKTIEGDPHFGDLAKMPHLLIAGATGTGKSVCINAIICSILYRQKPDRVKFLFVDPKRVELSLYQDIPHLLAPVVCDPKRAAGALAWVVEQMEERYEKLVEFAVRNIDGYNAIVADPRKHTKKALGKKLLYMPHMVIVLDELADLMVVAKNDVEEHIQRLAQMGRAVGIHLIVATQRPSVNVITGVIKANFPARIAFQVSSKADSRVIMDLNGAETLLGRGDMLFHPGGAPKPARIQGCFVSEAEVERLVEFIKKQEGPHYVIEEFQPLRDDKGRPLARLESGGSMDDWGDGGDSMDDYDDSEGSTLGPSRGTNRTMGSVDGGAFIPHAGGSASAGDDEIDEALVRAAARLVLETRKASVSLLQRRLKVGFARAGRLMDMLEDIGIVGPFQGSKPRDIIVDPEQFLARLDAQERQDAAAAGR